MLHFTTYTKDTNTEWVTFIHGAGGSSAIWYKQLRDFRKSYNVLLVDLRGHGQSKQPIYEKLRRYSFDTISDDIIEVLVPATSSRIEAEVLKGNCSVSTEASCVFICTYIYIYHIIERERIVYQ